jgi:cation diffusion facilitator family transporter
VPTRAQHQSANIRTTLAGVAVNVSLAIIKLAAGFLGHSYALIADAIESLTDIAGSLVIWHGLRVSAKPPDEDHPYGHGKAEALSALIVVALLLGAAVFIGIQAVRHIITPDETPRVWTLWVLLFVLATKETIFRIAARQARKSESSAMLAEAWHHRADAITSLFALIGISVTLFTGYRQADAIAALLAALLIVFNAIKIARDPLGELLDAHPGELVSRVRQTAESVPGVVHVEKVFARKSGGTYHVDMHLHVDPNLTVRDAHALGGKVKATIREKNPAVRDVLMHIEPAESEPKADA